MVHYNLACSLSLTRRLVESAFALIEAIRLGYRDLDWMMQDPDLWKLRADARFAAIKALLEGEVSRGS
jgi:hypothetical protein